MKLFLNTALKGLLVAFLIVTLGGFLYVNVTKTEEINLQLISSSRVNQVKSGNYKENNETDLETKIEENNEDKLNDKLEIENKEENLSQEKEDSTKELEIKNDEKDVEKEEKVEKENTKVETKTEDTSKSDQTNKKSTLKYNPNLEVAKTMDVIKTYNGLITAYGPDCKGCGGLVAHGENVSNGNIYYQDKTFGTIRIVAGDSSLKFGTIIRISGLSNYEDSLLAIVLDRGGDISFKKIYFDLLYESEKAADSFGKQQAVFEVLRMGF